MARYKAQAFKAPMERVKGAKKRKLPTVRTVPSASHDEKWDGMIAAALGRLDKGDYSGFWQGIDDLNAYAVISKG